MSKNSVAIDETRDVYVGADGRLLKRGTRRLKPNTEKDGTPYIELQSRTEPDKQEKRYLHVLVFEHHCTIPGVLRAQLGKDDVEIVDENKGIHITNLRLTESGLDKVENMSGVAESDPKSGAEQAPSKKKTSKQILQEAGLMDEEGNEISQEEPDEEESAPAVDKSELKSSKDILREAGMLEEDEESADSDQPTAGDAEPDTDGEPVKTEKGDAVEITDSQPGGDDEEGDDDDDGPQDEGEQEQQTAVSEQPLTNDEEPEAEAEVDAAGAGPQATSEGQPGGDEEAEEPADEDTSDEDVVLTAKPTTKGGNHYDLLNADGDSVLDDYNDGRKVNGTKNLDAIAEEHGVAIEIED